MLSHNRRQIVLELAANDRKAGLVLSLGEAQNVRDAIDRALKLAFASPVSPTRQ
jgi:hypothetical protein